jgi:hypothetical protein
MVARGILISRPKLAPGGPVTRTALLCASQPDDLVLILHVVHGSRDIVTLFGH